MANTAIDIASIERAAADLQTAHDALVQTIATMRNAGADSITGAGVHYVEKVVPQIVSWAVAFEGAARVKFRSAKPGETKLQADRTALKPLEFEGPDPVKSSRKPKK